jgi:pimeloyl-ACP methyl ester carboxylesterase
MAQVNVISLHGFASSGMGTKGQYFSKRFQDHPNVDFRAFEFTPTPKDFEYMTITGMIGRLRQFVLAEKLEPFQLIGSSFGALVGMNYAQRFGGVDRSLLLAPALSFSSLAPAAEEPNKWSGQEVIMMMHYAFDRELPLRHNLEIDGQLYRETPAPTVPVTIVHGTSDEVVPVQDSRDYAAEYPDLVRLKEVDAGHDLNEHLDFIWQQVGIG